MSKTLTDGRMQVQQASRRPDALSGPPRWGAVTAVARRTRPSWTRRGEVQTLDAGERAARAAMAATALARLEQVMAEEHLTSRRRRRAEAEARRLRRDRAVLLADGGPDLAPEIPARMPAWTAETVRPGRSQDPRRPG